MNGRARDFYRAVKAYYDDPRHWTRQNRDAYCRAATGSSSAKADAMWTFEPSAALEILEHWEKRDGLVIHRGKRLNRAKGKVKVNGTVSEQEKPGVPMRRIVSFETEDGTVYEGKMFLDCTYEGDLMAAAGVHYVIGREANSV